MNHAPFRTQGGDRRRQRVLDPVQVSQLEPITFTRRRRSTGAMQVEYRFAIRALYMDMSRSIVVRADHHP
jgi:hypothetical protein